MARLHLEHSRGGSAHLAPTRGWGNGAHKVKSVDELVGINLLRTTRSPRGRPLMLVDSLALVRKGRRPRWGRHELLSSVLVVTRGDCWNA
jgi:hypothetical protein